MATRRVTRQVVTKVDSKLGETESAYSALYQFVYLLLGIVEGFLLIRFIFRMFGANPLSYFVKVVYSVSDFLMTPFYYIFPSVRVETGVIEWPVLVAVLIYGLLVWVVVRLIDIFYTTDASE